MISEGQIDDIVGGLCDRERTNSWSTATFDPGVLSYRGSSAWVPSDQSTTNVVIRIGNRLMVMRGTGLFPPTWVRPTVKAILSILRLEPGWDLSGGRPIDPMLVGPAIKILSSIMDYDSPSPSVVPTSVGGIQFEWHKGGMDLEINVAPTGDALFEFEATNRQEIEGRLPDDIGVLTELISRLSK